MTVDQSVLQKAKTLSPLLVEIRRQIHRHPELGFEEFETSKLVCATLDRLGIFYRSGVARTGVIAEIGQGKAAGLSAL